MTSRFVAGVDWAGGKWLAVTFRDESYAGCILEEDFEGFWKKDQTPDLVLVDVPIGLPEDQKTRTDRERVDSLVRSVTGRPRSVFPVPSRGAARVAYKEGAEYEEVARVNQRDIGKGLNKQSYHITHGIGEIDTLLENHEQARTKTVESHPELCFRTLLGRQLQHPKNTAAGVGERLNALRNQIPEPGTLLEQITGDLVGQSTDVDIDDVLDALVLGLVASRTKDELMYLPEDWKTDPEGLPMRMAYWAEEPLSQSDWS